LRCLPGVSSEFQASQAAALRKKVYLGGKILWQGLIGGKMIFGRMGRVSYSLAAIAS
jgi:hypothetical protein